MTFQYVSDIHLELHKSFTILIKKSAPYLILAGDIGDPFSDIYFQFITFASENYKEVVIIAGNHEYYRPDDKLDISTVNSQIDKVAKQFHNVIFLNNKTHTVTHDDNTYKLIGTTMWSFIPYHNYRYSVFMNDYKYIYNNGKLVTPPFISSLYLKNVEYIKEEIKNTPDGVKIILVTHHLPSYSLIDNKYENHPLNCFFASHLDYLIQSPIVAWICGHTHFGCRKKINDVVCAVNPVGYPNESTNFEPDAVY
jgi:predicted phosphodiesterase